MKNYDGPKRLDYLKLRQDCDEWLRLGQSRKVANHLAELNSAKIPREERLPLAKLARRANMISLGLRLLTPGLMLEGGEFRKDVSEAEWAQYGVLLHLIGSSQEGRRILETVNSNTIPEALLYRAFCNFSHWEYAEARPLLEEYVELGKLSEYERLVGQVNLAAVYSYEDRRAQAIPLLLKVEAQTRSGGHKRLLANSLELQSQLEIAQKNFTRAEVLLEEASSILSDDLTFDQNYVRKWQCIVKAEKNNDPKPLKEFRSLAFERADWESVRDADLHLAILTDDQNLFQHLYFGTPYVSYRARFLDQHLKHDSSASYTLGAGTNILDVHSGKLNGNSFLNPGKKVHQFLSLLLSDFYRPFRVGSVFAELFPGEHFNIFSSPLRVHQVVFRSRQILEKENVKFEISETAGAYHFNLHPGTSVVLQRAVPVRAPQDVFLLQLEKVFTDHVFSAKQARKVLGLSLSTLNRNLKMALASKSVQQIGSGPRTMYKIAQIENTRHPKSA